MLNKKAASEVIIMILHGLLLQAESAWYSLQVVMCYKPHQSTSCL